MSHKDKGMKIKPSESKISMEYQEELPLRESESLKKLLKKRPAKWEQMPDIDIYMDQVLEYMMRQHIGLAEKETLTGAMVNNYIKKGLLPRTNGKKYNREHIAYLTAICLFKQVFSVDDTDTMLSVQLKNKEIDQFYEEYCSILGRELSAMEEKLQKLTAQNDSESESEKDNEAETINLILELAIASYIQKITCEKLLSGLKEKA